MKCMVENCKENAKVRGLCQSCYSSFSHLTKVGYLTWDEIINKGIALPARPLGRPHILTDKELTDILNVKFQGKKITSRQEYIDAIGGSLSIISKKHKAFLDSIFPPVLN